jgi:hypothetical protein
MRLLNTLNQVTEKMSNSNFVFIKNWADALSKTLDEKLSDLCKFTPEGGLAIRLKNGTGAASVKGSLVSASTTVDGSFVLQNNEFDTIGMVYETGIADGQLCWVVISGVAELLLKDSNGTTRGQLALAADTDGRAVAINVPSSNPVAAEHFKEVGHFIESKTAGTNVLAKAVIHFN